MSGEQARAELKIYGKVQGVFFRATTREEAQQRGLSGWVENQADGSVEAVVEGPRGQVEEMVDFAHQGPPRARVDEVDVTWGEPTGEFGGFRVRR